MKFYRNLVIIILIVAAIILFLRIGGPNLITPPPPPATPTPTPVSQPLEPVPQPMAAPPSGQATNSPPKVPVAPPSSYRQKLDAIARGMGVSIVAYREQGRKVNVTVEWIGDSVGPGGDFLDEGIKQGLIRDFKDQGFNEFYDRQGRRHFKAAYELYLN